MEHRGEKWVHEHSWKVCSSCPNWPDPVSLHSSHGEVGVLLILLDLWVLRLLAAAQDQMLTEPKMEELSKLEHQDNTTGGEASNRPLLLREGQVNRTGWSNSKILGLAVEFFFSPSPPGFSRTPEANVPGISSL